MGRLASFDGHAVAGLLAKQDGVISRGQAMNCNMSDAAVRHRIRPGGPWQPLLPGVYLSRTGTPTAFQRAMAALLYAGSGSVITGPAALQVHRIKAPEAAMVDVLVPAERRRRDVAFVRLHRTTKMPKMAFPVGEVSYVPAARAVADTVRDLHELSEVRAVVADAVQRRRVQVWHLAEELAAGLARGASCFRTVLAEIADGVRSVAEADLRTLIKHEGLPVPMYNPRLFVGAHSSEPPTPGGRRRAWPARSSPARGTWRPETGSARWPDARMSAFGIVVLHFPPRRLRTEPWAMAAETRSALAAGRDRWAHGIRALPPN